MSWGVTFAGCTTSLGSLYGFGLGGRFTVGAGQTVYVDALGLYPPGNNGSSQSGWGGGTVKLASTASPTTIIASATFSAGSLGTYDATNNLLYKTISGVTIGEGSYYVWVDGGAYSASAYHRMTTEGAPVARNTLGGKVSWSGSVYYGDALGFPAGSENNVDYLMATFREGTPPVASEENEVTVSSETRVVAFSPESATFAASQGDTFIATATAGVYMIFAADQTAANAIPIGQILPRHQPLPTPITLDGVNLYVRGQEGAGKIALSGALTPLD